MRFAYFNYKIYFYSLYVFSDMKTEKTVTMYSPLKIDKRNNIYILVLVISYF